MSNRLTFSLASLIVLIGLIVAPAFVHAANITKVEVTSTTAPYKIGEVIEFTVTWDAAVTYSPATSSPSFTLPFAIGTDTSKTAAYSSGSTKTQLKFEYTVATGDTGAVAIAAGSLAHNGTLQDASNTDADLTFVASNVTTPGDNEVVDTAAPTFTYVSITDTSPNPNPISTPDYGIGEYIRIKLTFGETGTGMENAGSIAFKIGENSRLLEAESTSANPTTGPDNIITFSYLIKAGDTGEAVIENGPFSLSIMDKAGNTVDRGTDLLGTDGTTTLNLGNVSSTDTVISDVVISSTGPYTDTSSVIDVTVTFSERITVTASDTVSPKIELQIGSGTADAIYSKAKTDALNDETKVVFSYTIGAADAGAVSIAASALSTPTGSAIMNRVFGNPANLKHSAVTPALSDNQMVDSAAPTVTITPPKALTAGKMQFAIDSDEALATSGTGALAISDIKVTNSKATPVAGDLTKEDTAREGKVESYTLTVTPKDLSEKVTVTLTADSVSDAIGNTAPAADKMAEYTAPDTFPPTVTITAPTTAKADGTLDFVFTFNEPLSKGQSDLEVSDFTITGGSTTTQPTITSVGNKYTLTVTPATAMSTVTVTLKANSVADLAGIKGPTTAVTRTYRPKAADTTPVFRTTTVANLPAGMCVGDKLPAGVTLPLADDNEGDTLTYTLTPALPAGLSWRTTDAQTRIIEGTATTVGTTTHTWTATDDSDHPSGDPSKDSVSITFAIVVKAHQKPTKPMVAVSAMKVDSASMVNTTMNRVELAWSEPTYDATYPACIPAVTSYTVYQRKLDEATGEFPLATMTHTEYTASALVSTGSAVKYTGATGSANAIHFGGTAAAPKFVSPELEPGIYEFAITATNGAGESPESDTAAWNKTLGKRVVVADVPAAPTDLRAAIHSGNNVTVNWLKVPDASDGGAPIQDDPKSTDQKVQNARDKYYGDSVVGDFAGYVLYQVNQATFEVTRYPEGIETLRPETVQADTRIGGMTDIFYNHPTIQILNLAAGEYVFRVTAVNIAGESLRSVSTPHAHVRVVAPTTTPPPVGGLPTNKVVNASYNASTGTTSLTSAGSLAPNDFAVINANALPDLQRFFAEGGTISVLNTSGTSKDIAISEIMWGLNLAKAVGAGRASEQFIELYNTTAAAINLSTVTIKFDASQTTPTVPTGKVLLDQISNIVGGWVITDAPGQDGSIVAGGDSLISMYRTIEYDNVVKTHNATDAKKNREAQLASVKDGNKLDSWAESNVAETYGANRVGSPGARHFKAFKPLATSTIDRSQVIINEIGNHSDDTYDWVELRNVSDADVNLKKWELSQVTGDATTKKDTQLVSFPDNDDHKILAGGVLLIVNSDPYRDTRHPIAAGSRINGGGEKTGTTSRYYVDGGLKLANSGDTLLILRNANDKEGKAEAFKDVVGTLSIKDDGSDFRTNMWPLAVTGAAHGNVIENDKDNKEDDFRSGKVYTRVNAGGGTGEKHWKIASYTGVGYKRSAANNGQNAGTPGYADADVKVNIGDLASDATVTISEIMYAKGRNLPQWIELYNSSMTHPVNISEWKLRIDNLRSDDTIDIRSPSVTTNNFGGGVIIQPNQTVLIVSGKTRRDSRAAQGGVDFPNSRVVDLWGQKDRIEVDTGKNNLSYQLLSQTAFSLTLLDKGGNLVETVGNLDTDRETVLWDLPSVEDMEEGRSSIIRRYPNDRKTNVETDGMMAAAWILASETNLAEVRFNDTYYGNSTDIGTPGYRGGGPLPVSLSKFRPERLDDGSIRIVWVTESELNNAGFNILRSEKRDGEFKQINTKLIAGQGTTSERTVYTHTDTSAKPNVVYYYQIQDVSLDGQVQTLRQSRLKGNVSAAGKLTTTWGELKALQ